MRVGAVAWGLGVGGPAATPPREAERWPGGPSGKPWGSHGEGEGATAVGRLSWREVVTTWG